MKTKDIRDIVLKELPTLLEQDRKWEDNQKVIHEMLESIKVMNRKYDSTIGALGARWGLRSEQSFRNALRGIFGEVSKLEVIVTVQSTAKTQKTPSPMSPS